MSVLEVIRDNKVYMHGEYHPGIYSPGEFTIMMAAGYTFRLGGKPWKPTGELPSPPKGSGLLVTGSQFTRLSYRNDSYDVIGYDTYG